MCRFFSLSHDDRRHASLSADFISPWQKRERTNILFFELTMCASRAPKKHTRMTSTMVRKAWVREGKRGELVGRERVSRLSFFFCNLGKGRESS